ncbi:hypothetical protein EIN_428160 [Entamoeba invadens IP1]|uniref:Uncharacterized protein n=2 Tax=Entamoeba invadens TaxID=33085 RepID=A0A0A1UEY0_ENTIV|nr:hypothetical protein EIN_428160 [Entamoeba invadens IP1]ELP95140.1 hypothetical protein EIN_428160 [Entamoeba invadens IP1]BAN40271.1 hypothetical protein [Entamoeba invadens]|eukprot:XP_004261911.1 hypothetical protein EIN_428160 [Entamoeba invadens IP1]
MSYRKSPSFQEVCASSSQTIVPIRQSRRENILRSRRMIQEPSLTNFSVKVDMKDLYQISEDLHNNRDVEMCVKKVKYLCHKTGYKCLDAMMDLKIFSDLFRVLVDPNSSCVTVAFILWIFFNMATINDVYAIYLKKNNIHNICLLYMQSTDLTVRMNSLSLLATFTKVDHFFSLEETVNVFIPKLVSTLNTFKETEMVEAVATCLEAITRTFVIPLEYLSQLLSLFFLLPNYPDNFLASLSNLVMQKPNHKTLLSKPNLLETIASELDGVQSTVSQSALNFLIDVSVLKQKYAQKLMDQNVLETVTQAFKESCRLFDDNKSLSFCNYFILFGNLCLMGFRAVAVLRSYNIFSYIFQETTQPNMFSDTDLPQLIFLFNNAFQMSSEEDKEYLICQQLYYIYLNYLKLPDVDSNSVTTALITLKNFMDFSEENEMGTNHYFIESGLHDIVEELSGNHVKKVSDIASCILGVHGDEDDDDIL